LSKESLQRRLSGKPDLKTLVFVNAYKSAKGCQGNGYLSPNTFTVLQTHRKAVGWCIRGKKITGPPIFAEGIVQFK